MAGVDYRREDYKKASKVWQIVDDATGEMLDDKLRTRYLPQPNPEDRSKENKARYAQYKQRAVWYGFTSRTLSGMLGAAFRKAAQLEVPAVLDYIKTDVDSAGVGIEQQAAASLSGTLKKGRHALYVDFPKTDGEVSRATMASQSLRPFIRSVDADDIINWRAEQVGGRTMLTLVVISEEHQTDDGFGISCVPQMRVLRLTASVYSVEIWRKDGAADFVMVEQVIPKKANGQVWSEIPFYFIGSENNDSNIDPSPLYDMAQLNVAHFRNSSDYEDSCYIVGQPMAYMAGLDQNWVDMLEKKGMYLGSRAILPLPTGGAAGILQPEPNSMPMEAMKHKEEQAISLGARLVQPSMAVKTATQSSGEQNVQHSVLSLCVKNTGEAYQMAITAMLAYAGAEGAAFTLQLNTEFVEMTLDAQMLTALIQLWQSGKFPEGDLWAQLKKYGVIDPQKTDETIKDELETSKPLGPGLDNTGDTKTPTQ